MAKRKMKSGAKAPRVPSDLELRRLKILNDYAKAHALALDSGLLDGRLPREFRVRRPPEPNDDVERKKLEQRLEMMIELETRWRLAELGLPQDDKRLAGFEHFRFDSDHRRKLEVAHMAAERERQRERSEPRK